MKKYKQSYLTGDIFLALRLATLCAIAFIPLAYLIQKEGLDYPLLLIPAIAIGIVAEFTVFGLMIDLITAPFKGITVCLDEERIIVDSDTQNLTYGEITSISLNLGNVSKHSNHPPYVTLMSGEEKSLTIERPSLLFLHTVRKRCKNAQFTVENFKKEVLYYLGIGLICAFIIGIAIFYGEQTQ